jgi:hypothetical protein
VIVVLTFLGLAAVCLAIDWLWDVVNPVNFLRDE